MGTRYGHLSLKERFEISRLRADGKSLRAIAKAIGRSASTVSRELRRNNKETKVWSGDYDPERAHSVALRRRRWNARFKLKRQPALMKIVGDLLAMGWSPQQISGRLARDNAGIRISHESIYRFIYHQSAQKDPSWHRLLPRAKCRRGRQRRRGGSPLLRIKDRVPISKRPRHVEKRKQLGHWEADLMLSATRQPVLVLCERASRLILVARPASKAASVVESAIRGLLAGLPQQLRRSITFDNGTEFATHHRLRKDLGMATFFCDRYAPWQKGSVENAISRLRRHLPRRIDLAKITPADLETIVIGYNTTPRACLGYRTPAEIMRRKLTLLHFNRETTCPPSQA